MHTIVLISAPDGMQEIISCISDALTARSMAVQLLDQDPESTIIKAVKIDPSPQAEPAETLDACGLEYAQEIGADETVSLAVVNIAELPSNATEVPIVSEPVPTCTVMSLCSQQQVPYSFDETADKNYLFVNSLVKGNYSVSFEYCGYYINNLPTNDLHQCMLTVRHSDNSMVCYEMNFKECTSPGNYEIVFSAAARDQILNTTL